LRPCAGHRHAIPVQGRIVISQFSKTRPEYLNNGWVHTGNQLDIWHKEQSGSATILAFCYRENTTPMTIKGCNICFHTMMAMQKSIQPCWFIVIKFHDSGSFLCRNVENKD